MLEKLYTLLFCKVLLSKIVTICFCETVRGCKVIILSGSMNKAFVYHFDSMCFPAALDTCALFHKCPQSVGHNLIF